MPENKAIGHIPNAENILRRRGKNHLFLVGIDDYVHHQKLTNAVSDAKSIKHVLTEQYGFDTNNVVELYDKAATSDAIKRQLLRYKSLSMDDNLLFFYSGHGYYLDSLGYLVPVDGVDEANFILNSTIRDFLKPIKAKHIALIFDSCFSGSFVLNKDASLGGRLSEKPSRWALAAGNIELVSDGIAGRNAPFTGALLDVLRTSSETELGIQELFVEARNLTVSRGANQTPIGGQMAMDGNDGGEFVFYRTNIEADTWNVLDKTDKNALNAFVVKYTNSDFVGQATAFIQEIEAKEVKKQQEVEAQRKADAEKQAFERAKKSGTKESLSHFIFSYPLSIYRPEARQLLAEAEESAAWKEAKRKNSLSAFLDFQEIYGSGQYSDECQERIDSFKKPTPTQISTPVETPKPTVVIETPKVEKPLPVVEKPKVENAQVVDNQAYGTSIEPLFFKKYKMFIIGGILLIAVVMWFLPKGGEKMTPSVSTLSTTIVTDNEAIDLQKTITIPDVNAYLQRYPNGKNRAAATEKLDKLRSVLNTHLNNVKSQINDFPEATKEDLDKARAIDPTNADVVKFSKQLSR